MFAKGSPIHTKFQVKLFKKGFFELECTVDSAENREDGTVKVTAKYARISDSDRAALTQFARDMEYLKMHVQKAAEES